MPAPPSSANDSVPFIAGGKLTPPPLGGANLDHINLRVTDVIRSARFYFSLFGGSTWSSPMSARPDEPAAPAILILFNGRVPYLILSQATPQHSPALDHLALGLRDWPDAEIRLIESNIPLEYRELRKCPYSFGRWIRDPSGIYFHDQPSDHTQLSARGIASHPDRDGSLTLHDPDGTILRLRTH